MLLRIPAGAPGMTSGDLKDYLSDKGYPVSKRTIERDLNELSVTFPLLVLEPEKKPYRWVWCRERMPELGTLSISDALSLCLMGNLLKTVLPKSLLSAFARKLEQAERTLAAMQTEEPNTRWRHKVRFVPTDLQLLPPEIDDKVLQTVQDAVVLEKQIEVSYTSFGAKSASQMTLNPCGLLMRGSVPYLITSIEPFTDLRQLPLHRMRRPKILQTKSKLPPSGFDIDAFITSGKTHFGTAEPIRLRANISNELAQYLAETPLAKDQKISGTQDPQTWTLTATVPNTWQLEMWILSQAEHVQVLAPTKLKSLIHNRLKMALERY